MPIARSIRSCSRLVFAALSMVCCTPEAPQASGPKLALGAPLLREVPAETRLRIGDTKIQKQLELSGLIERLPFKVEWQNINGGPGTLEAFRASALDAGAVGDTPTIHAAFTYRDVRQKAESHECIAARSRSARDPGRRRRPRAYVLQRRARARIRR
jgi:ABC-type nitrate/sulfonate/bicarbonate transport system substrate-binding protein